MMTYDLQELDANQYLKGHPYESRYLEAVREGKVDGEISDSLEDILDYAIKVAEKSWWVYLSYYISSAAEYD